MSVCLSLEVMGRLSSKGHRGTFWSDRNVLYIVVVVVTQVYAFVIAHQIVYVKWVHFIIRKTTAAGVFSNKDKLGSRMELYGLDSNPRFS